MLVTNDFLHELKRLKDTNCVSSSNEDSIWYRTLTELSEFVSSGVWCESGKNAHMIDVLMCYSKDRDYLSFLETERDKISKRLYEIFGDGVFNDIWQRDEWGCRKILTIINEFYVCRKETEMKREKNVTPVWRKPLLTLNEAAEYFGIGINKLREICDTNSEFALYVGSKRLIKKDKLENFLMNEYYI